MAEFWLGVAKYLVSLIGFTGLLALYDWYDKTERLRKYAKQYTNYGEFEFKNQSDEFTAAHRVKAFEILLRNLDTLRPWTLPAYKRVEAVRDVVEYFHRNDIPVLGNKHLPLPRLGEFPFPPSLMLEAHVTAHVLEGLRAIKWLGLEERAGH